MRNNPVIAAFRHHQYGGAVYSDSLIRQARYWIEYSLRWDGIICRATQDQLRVARVWLGQVERTGVMK